MLKNSSNKKLSGTIIIFVVLMFALVGGVSAKYIHDLGTAKKLFRAKEFYFTSDLLSENGKDYYLNADAESVTFTLGNNADELRFSEDDIHYEVTVTIEGSTAEPIILMPNEKKDKILTGNGIDVDSLTLSGLEKDKTYIVTAVGTAGYVKTLTATFTLAKDDVAVYKHLEKKDAYVLLTVWAENMEGTLSVKYPFSGGTTTLIPDNTDPMMKNVKNYSDGEYRPISFDDNTSFTEKYSSYTYRFFIDEKGTISVDDFNVLMNREHVANPSEPK